ncbi:class I SAM-dependent methyltransferase [Amycolatopsis sp. NBC_00345]|uniref:class I SAM-dependent methyltransferase n=1 Tax=Amycolatopsis sp. NBC_00345 TaxID=2975955 RepID=UPI002E25EC91
MTASAEDFLRRFHDQRPEAQSGLSLSGPVVGDGRKSYDVLADRVAGARRVLDLGCGDGLLLETLAGRGAELLAGIDLSSGELEACRRRPALADADLRQGRAQELPFADGSFDAVVSHMALMLMADVPSIAAEVARVLAPGGTFAVAVGAGPLDAAEVFLSFARPMFDKVPKERQAPQTGDPRTRRRDGLDELLAPAGFGPVSWDTLVLDLGGPADEVWQRCRDTYYPVSTLDDAQLAELRAAFEASTRELLTEDGRLPSGAKMSLAVTRLRS